MRDHFVEVPILADSRESLEKEIEFFRKNNEELNPRFKIFLNRVEPDPDTVVFTKNNYQLFQVFFHYELNL